MSANKIEAIKSEIFKAAGGKHRFLAELPFIFRQAIDELIDAPRTRRLRMDELEPNEKAILGIKVEAALRYLLDFPRGKLDFRIGGHDVDVKFSIATSWMIPPEAIGYVCILCSADDAKSLYSFGLCEASVKNLTAKGNRDQKRSFSSEGKKRISWLAHNESFPSNIWETIDILTAESIFEPEGGTERITRLFRAMTGKPIHRSTIHAVARQHDYMKRIRANQGARDFLHPEGIVVLSGSQDGPLLRKLGISLGRDFVMPYRPRDHKEATLITAKSRHATNFRLSDR